MGEVTKLSPTLRSNKSPSRSVISSSVSLPTLRARSPSNLSSPFTVRDTNLSTSITTPSEFLAPMLISKSSIKSWAISRF